MPFEIVRLGESDETVEVADLVLKHLARYRQLGKRQTEAGGQLFGTITGSTISILEAKQALANQIIDQDIHTSQIVEWSNGRSTNASLLDSIFSGTGIRIQNYSQVPQELISET